MVEVDIYMRELGLRHYRIHHLNETYYNKKLIEICGRLVRVIKEPPHYFPSGVLGWTNGVDEIHLRNDLNKFGYFVENFVLAHEEEHIKEKDPMRKSDESLMDQRAMARLGLLYRPI